MEVTLRRWELTGTQTYGMAKLAGAWKGQPAAYAAIPRRIGSHSPNAYEFKEELGRGELFLDRDALFLLLQCQFPVGTDEQAQRDLRAWTLLTALWHASQGHQTQDRLLASFCAALRQAAYEVADPVWRRALMPLGHAAVSFATLTKRIETLTGDDLRRSGRSESEIRILLKITDIARRRTSSMGCHRAASATSNPLMNSASLDGCSQAFDSARRRSQTHRPRCLRTSSAAGPAPAATIRARASRRRRRVRAAGCRPGSRSRWRPRRHGGCAPPRASADASRRRSSG